MILTVKLAHNIEECQNLLEILHLSGLTFELPFNSLKDVVIINESTSDARRMIFECSDVVDMIVDRERDMAI